MQIEAGCAANTALPRRAASTSKRAVGRVFVSRYLGTVGKIAVRSRPRL
jgi:hypothetical protein